MKAVLTPHNGWRQFDLSGIRTYDHPHARPELYHCATDARYIKVTAITTDTQSVPYTLILEIQWDTFLLFLHMQQIYSVPLYLVHSNEMIGVLGNDSTL